MTDQEAMARIACNDHGYTFLAMADDVSGTKPVPGFTYLAKGQDASAPSWVSLRESCFEQWGDSHALQHI